MNNKEKYLKYKHKYLQLKNSLELKNQNNYLLGGNRTLKPSVELVSFETSSSASASAAPAPAPAPVSTPLILQGQALYLLNPIKLKNIRVEIEVKLDNIRQQEDNIMDELIYEVQLLSDRIKAYRERRSERELMNMTKHYYRVRFIIELMTEEEKRINIENIKNIEQYLITGEWRGDQFLGLERL